VLLDPRNGQDFDLPAPAAPGRTFVVASVPRSGSTLLCRMLWDTGQVGAPKEYLNPMQLRDWEVRLGESKRRRGAARALRGPLVGALSGRWGWDQARLRGHVERVRQRRSGGGWFGVKLHHHHLRRWFADGDVTPVLGPVRWIRIRREDQLAQAVSWARALQTGQWASWQRPFLPPIYRRRAIAGRLQAITDDEAGWDRALAGGDVLDLTFEQLISTPHATLRRVLGWLEVPEPVRLPGPPTQRQADSTSAEWIARYQRETANSQS
jgi:trehalose 2-sulfotransferase